MALVFTTLRSPVGCLRLVASDAGLRAILWPTDGFSRVAHCQHAVAGREHPQLTLAQRQLEQYFAGERRTFALPLDPVGTAFARRVWQALQEIPYGQTRTYGQLAAALGAPRAARAVGLTNGRNPLAIVVPCHRVIGAGGKLTGFAGGLPAKSFLLALEAQQVGRQTLDLFAPC